MGCRKPPTIAAVGTRTFQIHFRCTREEFRTSTSKFLECTAWGVWQDILPKETFCDLDFLALTEFLIADSMLQVASCVLCREFSSVQRFSHPRKFLARCFKVAKYAI